jgi:lipopolysaccharide export system permease protein
MLNHYHRYILKLLAWPMLLITFSLTCIIWLTQALRFIDFIINRGLSVIDFVHITLLLVPSLLTIILPVALFISVIFCYNKLVADSELVVMEASGLSPWQLARPALGIGLGIMLLSYALSLYIMPAANRQFKDMQNFLRDNYTSVLLQEEVFNHPAPGLTVFVRARDDQGGLEGILVHDNRVSGQSITMMADKGRMSQTPRGPRFLLINGMRQELREGRISWLDFDSYNLDLSFYTQQTQARVPDARERFVRDLFSPKENIPSSQRNKFLAEAHQRLTWPLYSLGMAMLAVAILLRSEFNRRGRWKRITLLSLGALGIVLVTFGLTNLTARMPMLAVFMYLNALMVVLASGYLLLRRIPMQPRGNWGAA